MSGARTHRDDLGLAAVRRVRVAREEDSRFGLQRALAEARVLDEEAGRSRDRLAATPGFGTGKASGFHRHRERLTGLARSQRAAEENSAAGSRLAEEARVRWLADRTALRVADLLLARRADERAAERTRRETAQADDLAAVRWLRNRATEAREGGVVR